MKDTLLPAKIRMCELGKTGFLIMKNIDYCIPSQNVLHISYIIFNPQN